MWTGEAGLAKGTPPPGEAGPGRRGEDLTWGEACTPLVHEAPLEEQPPAGPASSQVVQALALVLLGSWGLLRALAHTPVLAAQRPGGPAAAVQGGPGTPSTCPRVPGWLIFILYY